MSNLTARERMIRALNHQEADHLPCCFMSFTALRHRCQENMFNLAKAEIELGLDAMLFIPAAPRPARTPGFARPAGAFPPPSQNQRMARIGSR